jgi:hypothetical protein
MNRWEVILAILALFSSMSSKIWPFTSWIRALLIIEHQVEHGVAAAIANKLKHRSWSRGALFYLADPLFFGEEEPVILESLLEASRVFWVGMAPLRVRITKNDSSGDVGYHFQFIRGTIRWISLLRECVDANTCRVFRGSRGLSLSSKRYEVVHHTGSGRQHANTEINKTSAMRGSEGICHTHHESELRWPGSDRAGLSRIHLPPILVDLADEIRIWKDDKDWYAVRDIPWRMGILLHGMRGTGKTAFIRAIAEELDLPIHVFDIASMSNAELIKQWREVLYETPCIVLFEDFDAVFRGRERVSSIEDKALTFDAVLNLISGIEPATGLLLFVTTNHLEHIDSALCDRPGRIDRVIEVGPLGVSEKIQIAHKILRDIDLPPHVSIDMLAAQTEGMPAARFVEECRRIALHARRGEASRSDRVSEIPYRRA